MASKLSVYYPGGGVTAYFVILSADFSQAWQVTGTPGIVAFNVANWATYAIAATANPLNDYVADTPAALPAGAYSFYAYVQAGGSPVQAADTRYGRAVDKVWNGLTLATPSDVNSINGDPATIGDGTVPQSSYGPNALSRQANTQKFSTDPDGQRLRVLKAATNKGSYAIITGANSPNPGDLAFAAGWVNGQPTGTITYIIEAVSNTLAPGTQVNINPAQLLGTPRDQTGLADVALTVGDGLLAAIGGGTGNGAIVGTTYTVKTPAGTTLRNFTLNDPVSPTIRS